jgi:hypothetical protein
MDLEEIYENVDWFRLNEDRNQWSALVNMIINISIP